MNQHQAERDSGKGWPSREMCNVNSESPAEDKETGVGVQNFFEYLTSLAFYLQ
jgi:hypothetical protein